MTRRHGTSPRAVEVLVEQARAGRDVDTEGAKAERKAARAELDRWKNKPQNAESRSLKDCLDWAQALLDARGRA